MSNLRIKFIVMILLSMFPLMSIAYWTAKVDEDLFSGGKSAMLAGEYGNAALVVDCNSDGYLSLSLLEKGKDINELLEKVTFDIAIKVDDKKVINSKGKIKKRNEQYLAVVTDDKEFIVKFLSQLRVAKEKVTVGLRLLSEKHASTMDVLYSTKSVNKVMMACNIIMDNPAGAKSFLDGYYDEPNNYVTWSTILSEGDKLTFIVNSCAFSVNLKKKDEHWNGYLDNDFDGANCGPYFNNIKVGQLLMTVNPITYNESGKVLSFAMNPTKEFRYYVNKTKGISDVAREYFGSSGFVYESRIK